MTSEEQSRGYRTQLLTEASWDDFAACVEANNGVWGGCWCMGFHPEGLDTKLGEHAGHVRVEPGRIRLQRFPRRAAGGIDFGIIGGWP